MLIKNNGTNPITMNLRDGSSYVLQPGVPTSVPDAATTMIDDSPVLIALFNAGTLTVTTDAGGAFSGFPTVVNSTDSAAGKLLTVHAKVGAYGSRTLVDSTGASVGGNSTIGSRIAPVSSGSIVANLPIFTAAVKNTMQRKSPTIVLINGDSTEAGFGVGSGNNGFVGARKSTHAAQLARMLGWNDSGVVGAGCGTDVALNLYDERASISGAGLTVQGNVGALGSGWVMFANGSVGVYSITPRGNRGFDRVRVVYGRYATGGASSMSVLVGGTSIGTFDARGGTGLGDTQAVEFPCTYAGPHTPITIQGTSGTTDGQCIISAVIWYDSTDPGVIVLNGGASGAKIADMDSNSNPWAARFVRAAIAPHLNVLNAWINDTYYRTAPATYATQLAGFKTNAGIGVTSDIVYMGYQPINDASMTDGQGDAIWAALLAAAGSAPVIDLREVFGTTYAAAAALGIFGSDALHINAKGQYYKACGTAPRFAI